MLRLAPDGTLTSALYLGDIASVGGEQGLLGLTFTAAGDLAYADFTDLDGNTNIVELPVLADGTLDRGQMRTLLVIDQPYANHNGGDVAIGPDGMLYIGMGDGGSGGDPERRALDLSSAARQAPAHRSDAVGRPRLHDPARQPVRRRPTARGARSGRSGCATRGATRSTRPPGTCGSPTSARTPPRRSTWPRPPAGSTPARVSTSGGARSRATIPTTPTSPRADHHPPIYTYPHGTALLDLRRRARPWRRRRDARRMVRVRRLLHRRGDRPAGERRGRRHHRRARTSWRPGRRSQPCAPPPTARSTSSTTAGSTRSRRPDRHRRHHLDRRTAGLRRSADAVELDAAARRVGAHELGLARRRRG